MQTFVTIKFNHGIDHFTHVPDDNLVQFVERQIDAMIGQAILGKL